MRRIVLLVFLLPLLGLTTAVASSFDVQSDDVATFTQAVDITVPDGAFTGGYALTGAPDAIPGALLPIPEPPATLPDTSTQSKSVEHGGSLLGETRPEYYHEWRTAPLTAPLTIASPVAQLFITQTGNAGPMTAGLFDCGSGGCDLIAAGTASPVGGTVTVSFGEFTTTILTGNQLGLRVVNSGENKYNLQWGFKDNRPARLVFEAPAPVTP